MDLAARQAELEAQATRRGLEWKERLSELPEDPRIRVAALATLLGLDAHRAAAHPEVTVTTLDAQGPRDERGAEEDEQLLHEYGEIGEQRSGRGE